MIGFSLIRVILFASNAVCQSFLWCWLGLDVPLYTDVTLREYFSLVPIFPLWSVGIVHKVKDHLRRLIGEVPRLCAICMPHSGRKGKCCVYSLAKVSIFFRRNRLSLQQKVRAFRIQSSEVENLRAFFPFFPCFSAEPPLFERSPPLFRSVPLPSFPFCSPASPTRPARSRV